MLSDRVLPAAVLALSCTASACTTPDSVQSNAAGNIVTIDSGMIEGAVSGDVLSFKGIPYATPPVGPLRWRAPGPVTPWSGVRPATKYGADCVQKPVGGDVAPTGGEFAEDCLFVSVWAPATAGPDRDQHDDAWRGTPQPHGSTGASDRRDDD